MTKLIDQLTSIQENLNTSAAMARKADRDENYVTQDIVQLIKVAADCLSEACLRLQGKPSW